MLPLCLHYGVLLFAHGAADIVSLSKGEACQLAEDLHDLLLIDDASIGNVKDVRQLGRLITDLVRLVAVAQVSRDGVHRAGAVKADESDDIFKILRLQTHQHLFHARGFELEHALRLALPQHLIRRRIVVIQLLDGERGVFFLDGQLGVPDDRQGAQAKEVHLQQTQLFDLGHVELGNGQAVVGGQWQIVVRRLRRDDHAGRVGGGVAGHSLHLQGGIDQLCDLRVAVVHPLQLRRDFQRAFQRHFQLHGHLLCHDIHALVGQSHHAAHVADGVAGRHGAEGDDLGHMVRAILPVDVVDDLLTALVAEINVEIGHTDALRVQETLEDEVVANGVDVGDAHAVGRDAARTRATSRADRDALTLGVVDVVPDDEVIVGVAHRLDDADLVGQPVFVGLGDVGAIAALEAVPAELLEECLIVHPVRGFVIGDLGVTEIKVKLTRIRDLLGIGAGLRNHCEQIIHLIGGFDVKLIGLELHPVGVLNGLSGLDAEQDALHLGVIFSQIVGIVGGGHRDAGLPGQLDELGQDDVVLLEAVVL